MDLVEKLQRAYHEASHAIVAYSLGWTIEHANLYATLVTKEGYDPKVPLSKIAPQLLWERAVIGCAGEIGHSLIPDTGPTHPQTEDHSDRDRFLQAWRAATNSGEPLSDLVRRAEAAAQNILDQNRVEVKAIATIIDSNGIVESDQAQMMIGSVRQVLAKLRSGELSDEHYKDTPIADHLMDTIHESTAAQMRELLNDGLDVNTRDEYSRTILGIATEMRRADIVQLLIDRGANVDLQDDEGYTPLHSAVEDADYEIVGLLLDAGADMSILGGSDCGTALHKAARRQDVAMVKLLLDSGADPDAEDCDGDTASYLQRFFHARPPELTRAVLDLLKQAGSKS